MRVMLLCFFSGLCLFATSTVKPSQKSDEQTTNSELITELTKIDSPGVGFHPTAWATAFVAEDTTPKFSGGVLGSYRPGVNPAFRELVKLGIRALPDLIEHLSDKRETKLKVGNVEGSGDFVFMFQLFGSEYSPKSSSSEAEEFEVYLNTIKMKRSFSGSYTVKVGDICYAAVGQIVNRALLPVRYQPSAGLVVNSPIETLELKQKVEADWGKATAEDLRQSLASDFTMTNPRYSGLAALKRLRYYFPTEYQRLKQGSLKEKIARYEMIESAEKN
jgi:hypothetical protein